MQTLDPYTIPLNSINLIEASAGTGKSWTVTLLFLRLILEKNLTVDQILVVTFTEAATKELRDDVRQRLVSALAAFRAINEHGLTDEFRKEYGEVLELVERETDYAEAIRRLNRAKLSLDEAAIFTIHGFCQRTLSENAFEAGLPFESELMDDDRELMQNLTDDFWRRYTENAPKSLIFKLHQKSVTPDSLLQDIRNAVGKPYLELCGPQSGANTSDSTDDKWAVLEQGLQNIIKQWQTDGEEITRILLEDKNLNGNKFRKPTVAKLCNEMNQIKARFDLNADFIESAQKFKRSYIETGTKAKCAAPEHSFFTAWESFSELWEQLNKGSDDFLNNTRIELLRYLQEELPKEKKRLGVLSFDDLLLQLQQALKTKPELATELRKKYKAALIDEFQDTDPIQYDIFSAIYNDSQTQENAVFLVGDPKQAIYSFRGGDIHTYLKAKADTHETNHHTLKTNWRSHDKLISAFNILYGHSDNPFQDEDIKYVQVKSGKDLNDIEAPEARIPLQLWRFNQTPGEKPQGKPEGKPQQQSADSIRKEIADAVAGDIAELLNASNQGKATIEGNPIGGGDIAILIRSHKQGDMIKAALNQRKIASVQSSKQSIFETHEAVEIHRLLTAIADPQREDNVRRALVTELMGYQAQDLLDLEAGIDNNNAWEEILLSFQNWHYQWKHQGFLPMMRALMKSQNTHQHLLNFMDGERRITNTLHLAEIIHQAVRKKSLSLEEVLLWLKQRQENSSATESELRLESDENLVKIVTIHKSKGLEYPIVYCPFIGLSPKPNSNSIFTFHKDQSSYLEIGSAESEDHKELKRLEEMAEDTRLLYVALTRAKYQCNIVVFPDTISGSPDRSALGWLLTNGKTNPSGSAKAEKEQKADFQLSYEQNLHVLVAAGDGNISLDDLPEYPQNLVYQSIESDQTLTAREFTGEIKSQAQITSFSGLTAGAHAETPDYDSVVDSKNNQAQLSQLQQSEEGIENSLEEFPKGSTAGTALHEIYEHIDFTVPIEDQTDIFNTILEKYSFEEKYKEPAMRLIAESLEAQLVSVDTETFSLNQLNKDQRLDEMEFYLPLERLNIEKLKQTLFQHLPIDDESDPTPKWSQVREAVDTLYFDEVEGYLKGFIDLIFEYQGKYYLADYKSNTLENYAPEKLFTPMAESHYYLQYLIYCVALHRYLQQRLPSYQWDTHFGGAYYLFIRGMKKAEQLDQDSQKSAPKVGGALRLRSGTSSTPLSRAVFYHKPSLELINALDGLFMRLSP